MPLEVRYRLDLVGLKLSLAAWQGLDLALRIALCTRPVSTDGEREDFIALIDGHVASVPRIEPAPQPPPWCGDEGFSVVAARASELGFALQHAAWNALDDEQRYGLFKTSAKGKREARFVDALREFALA
jgi:hypothetical protein